MKLLSLILAVFVFIGHAVAQMGGPPPPPHIKSVELFASASQTIVIGTMADYPPGVPDWQPKNVGIAVSEVLKGDPPPRLSVSVTAPATELAKMRDNSDVLLVALTAEPNANATLIDLSGSNLAVITSELKLIRNRDAVLQLVREIIRRPRGKAPPGEFSVPIELRRLQGTPLALLRPGYQNLTSLMVDVPIDERLERLARAEVRSHNGEVRLNGVQALAYFPSEQNFALIKTLSADSSYIVQGRPEDNKGFEQRYYPVRDAVYRVLTRRPGPLTLPVTRESISRLGSIESLQMWAPVTDEDFARLQSATRLKTLVVYSRVTDNQVSLIGRLTNLRRLTLYEAGVTDVGLRHLAGLKNLQYLNLDNNSLTGAGLKALEDLPSLQEVSLNGMRLPHAALASLAKANPKLRGLPEFAAMLPETDAVCKRAIYVLTNPDLEPWTSKSAGRLTGPLKWSRSPSGRDYLGPFGQQSVTLELSGLPKHGNVHVEIELFVIGSWDGNGKLGAGPDIMDIRIPSAGVALHSTFFNNTEGDAADLPLQSYPDPYPYGEHKGYTGAAEVRSLGFTEPWAGTLFHRDAVYKLRYTFAHTGSKLQIVFTGQTVPQSMIERLEDDEHWGLGGLVVKTD